MEDRIFAALRFTEDANLYDRVYWYLSDFKPETGSRVFAPVGPHDRIQLARVESVAVASEENAPYDIKLIKHVIAREGDRTRMLGNTPCREFGGVRYDNRHYTRFGRILLSEEEPSEHEGFTAFVAPMSEDGAIYRNIALGHGTLLVGGEGKHICMLLLKLLEGEDVLCDLSVQERSRLCTRLG